MRARYLEAGASLRGPRSSAGSRVRLSSRRTRSAPNASAVPDPRSERSEICVAGPTIASNKSLCFARKYAAKAKRISIDRHPLEAYLRTQVTHRVYRCINCNMISSIARRSALGEFFASRCVMPRSVSRPGFGRPVRDDRRRLLAPRHRRSESCFCLHFLLRRARGRPS